MWHASIAVQTVHGPKQLSGWTKGQNQHALQLAGELLAGVGQGGNIIKRGNFCLHVRRLMSDREMVQLDPRWLLLPAIDLAE